jgi:cellulose synthase operon protein C
MAPDDADTLAGYAQMLHRLNDPKALATAEKAMKMQPDNAAFAGLYGSMLASKGDLEGGIRIMREARLREPGDGIIRWNLASALAKAGRKAEARDELRAALASGAPPRPGAELTALKADLGL